MFNLPTSVVNELRQAPYTGHVAKMILRSIITSDEFDPHIGVTSVRAPRQQEEVIINLYDPASGWTFKVSVEIR